MTRPASASAKGRSAARTGRRVAVAVVGAVVLLAVIRVASIVLDRFRRAGGPSPQSNIAMLESNAENLRVFGVAWCPTVQQILELTPEPARSFLLMDTNGIDPWGTPYQIECDHDNVRAFSMGPDKQAGTADDIRWKH